MMSWISEVQRRSQCGVDEGVDIRQLMGDDMSSTLRKDGIKLDYQYSQSIWAHSMIRTAVLVRLDWFTG